MLRRQSVLQTVSPREGSAVTTPALSVQAWAREACLNAESGVPEEVAGVTFRINDHASFFIEGGKLANKIVKTSVAGCPDIRSWTVADRPVNASPRLSF
jgi:hypothetical protein